MMLTKKELRSLTTDCLNRPSKFNDEQMETVVSCFKTFANECADSLGVNVHDIGGIIGASFEIGYFAGLQAAKKGLTCESQSLN